jgi:hypothetical protein
VGAQLENLNRTWVAVIILQFQALKQSAFNTGFNVQHPTTHTSPPRADAKSSPLALATPARSPPTPSKCTAPTLVMTRIVGRHIATNQGLTFFRSFSPARAVWSLTQREVCLEDAEAEQNRERLEGPAANNSISPAPLMPSSSTHTCAAGGMRSSVSGSPT